MVTIYEINTPVNAEEPCHYVDSIESAVCFLMNIFKGSLISYIDVVIDPLHVIRVIMLEHSCTNMTRNSVYSNAN